MKVATEAHKIEPPAIEPVEQFKYSANTDLGFFEFNFKWLNDRWDLWVTLPDETIRQASVYPNVMNWTGYLDYGLIFLTDLTEINFNSIFIPELIILKWE